MPTDLPLPLFSRVTRHAARHSAPTLVVLGLAVGLSSWEPPVPTSAPSPPASSPAPSSTLDPPPQLADFSEFHAANGSVLYVDDPTDPTWIWEFRPDSRTWTHIPECPGPDEFDTQIGGALISCYDPADRSVYFGDQTTVTQVAP